MLARQLIVRRDLNTGYYDFLHVLAKERNLDLIVDRRAKARRQRFEAVAGERRFIRRRRPPESWRTAGFIVVESPE